MSDPVSESPEETLDGGIDDWGDDGDIDGGRAKAVLAFVAGRLVDEMLAV